MYLALNVNGKMKKFLEENIGDHFCDLGVATYF